MADVATNLTQVLTLYDKERQEAEPAGMRREAAPNIVRLIDLAGRASTVIYSRLTRENVESTIRGEIEYFENLGQDFEWKVFAHDTPADLKARLIAQGFEAEEPEAILVLDLQAMPEALLPPVSQDVRRIADPGKINDVITVQEEVWQEDHSWLARRLAEELRTIPEYLSVYVAYVDGAPVSTAWIYFPRRGSFASLFGGSTLPSHRKRGFYTALLAVRAQEAHRRGVRFLTVDAQAMSRPILEKFDFQLLTWACACMWRVNRPR